MWQNSELKQKAKSALNRFGYWTPFFATIVTGLLMTDPSNLFSIAKEFPEFERLFENEETAATIGMVSLSVFIISFLCNIFIGFPILVGMNRFFMENRLSGSKVERVFWVFKSGNYFNVVKIMFLMNLKIFLWSLLLFIPGIIKNYEYYMVPYILSENPGIDSERAFELSKKMTDNEKFDIFLLELSFIGWILLGSLTCGIGILFLEPYYQATFAELYQVMREKAFKFNFYYDSELPGFGFEQN